MKRIGKEQILFLHHLLIKYSGGSDGIRDDGLLESALNAPFITFGGISNFPSLASKAARLAFGLVKNHPFVDGNKRIGVLAMLSFLEINGVMLNLTDDQLIKIGLGLAEGTMDEKMLTALIIEHSADTLRS
jgi:death-on-curing protein